MEEGVFPSMLKFALIKLLYKKGDKSELYSSEFLLGERYREVPKM